MSDTYARDSAAQGIRSGKYRHIFGEITKATQHFKEIKNPLTNGEGSYLKANSKFFAVSKSSGGGPVYIRKLNNPGRQPANQPVLSVQKGKVLDMDFHPFITNMIATVSEDCSVAVSQFPLDGLTKTINKSVIKMKGHGKKVALCQFNPSSNSILASGSFDRTVKVWNIETGACVSTFKNMKDNVYSMEWNLDGSFLACTSKDKKLHLFDPRVCDEATNTDAFDGTKSSKIFWLPNLGWIGATGFSKQAKRQIKMWDLKDMSKPIYSLNLDNAASVNMPCYDNDSGVLFYFGKGDGSVSWAEIVNDNKKLYPLGSFRSNEPQKGGGFVPKKGLDVWKCEIARFMKLTKNAVIPCPLIVPRKAGADVFQTDIYPDAYAGKPALTGADWLKGENKNPILMSLDPDQRDASAENDVKFTKKKTYEELEAENEKLKETIKELNKKLGINDDDEAKEDDKYADDEAKQGDKGAYAAADDKGGNDAVVDNAGEDAGEDAGDDAGANAGDDAGY